MNGFEFDLALAWLAVQVTLVLIPAAILHSWASRRGAAQGAWMAVAGLGVVLALSVASVSPRPQLRAIDVAPVVALPAGRGGATEPIARPDDGAGEPSRSNPPGSIRPEPIRPHFGFMDWVEKLQHNAGRSATRFPQGSKIVASCLLAGMAFGLIRLMIGVWGIGLCRHRGKAVVDPGVVELLEGLRVEMGCARRVDLREIPDLGTAATAGWLRPLILLPDDWRAWDPGERRAVFAHELAHIVRADYAAGLLARLVLAVHFYHPLAHWLTGRLLAQQELAADALGSRFAGGKESYLLALSRLALRQDERASFWPARGFLPAKGTLIRRIAMLTNLESNADRSWTWMNRLPAAALLLAVGLGVLALPSPTRGDGDDAASKVALKESSAISKPRDRKPTSVIDLSYLPADARGFMAFQPAAICRREGMDELIARMNADPESRDLLWIGLMEFGCFPYVYSNTHYTKDDMPTTDSRFRIEQVEQISYHFTIDPLMIKGQKFRRITPRGHMIRMVEPFDWEKQARIWWPKLKAVTGLRRAYYRINSREYVDTMCAFFPDDRTLVMDSEASVRMLINRENPAVPQFVEGLDWEKLRRSLFVLAINNHDHRMAGILIKEGGRDAIDTSRIFEQADVWAFHLEDTDAFSMKAFATCASNDLARPLAIATEDTLIEGQSLTLNLDATDKAKGHAPGTAIRKMFADILTGYEVVPSGTTVNVIPRPSVKLADFFAAMGRYAAKQSEVHGASKSK